jgi:hypothetical protein
VSAPKPLEAPVMTTTFFMTFSFRNATGGRTGQKVRHIVCRVAGD